MDFVNLKTINRFLSLEIKKEKKSILNKVLLVLSSASQNICANQACKKTGLYAHSKDILKELKKYSLSEIELIFFQMSLSMLKFYLQHLNIHSLKLAIDITKVPYYGKLDNPFVSAEIPKGIAEATGSYQYLTISCVNTNCKLILANFLMKPGTQIEKFIPDVLDEIRKIRPIKIVLLDRGFTNLELVYQLLERRLKFIIFWKKSGNWFQPIYDEMEDEEMRPVKFQRKIYLYPELQTIKFDCPFIFVKNYKYEKDSKAYNWLFCSNAKFEEVGHCIATYKERWGIETIYRVIKQEFMIKTTSKHQSVRLFEMCFSMFFYNLWQCGKFLILLKFLPDKRKKRIVITANLFMETLRFGLKHKYRLKSDYENIILDFLGLN